MAYENDPNGGDGAARDLRLDLGDGERTAGRDNEEPDAVEEHDRSAGKQHRLFAHEDGGKGRQEGDIPYAQDTTHLAGEVQIGCHLVIVP